MRLRMDESRFLDVVVVACLTGLLERESVGLRCLVGIVSISWSLLLRGSDFFLENGRVAIYDGLIPKAVLPVSKGRRKELATLVVPVIAT